jgi:hypothetical protein
MTPLAACGTDSEPQSEPQEGAEVAEIPGNADPESVGVIDEWARTLAEGDVDGAAEFFAIPSVAENSGVIVEIEERADARLFNASLPCGARLEHAETAGKFTVATFRLIERPGPGSCGSGTGALCRSERARGRRLRLR